MKKRLISLCVAMVMTMSFISSGVSASSGTPNIQNPEAVLTAEMRIKLIEIGFTDKEIIELVKAEPEKQRQFKNEISAQNRKQDGVRGRMSLPSNPVEGRNYSFTCQISNADLSFMLGTTGTLTKTVVAKAIVTKLGLGAVGGVLLAAGTIINLWNAHEGYRGYNVTVTYYYGRDNHGGIGWTIGPIQVHRYR